MGDAWERDCLAYDPFAGDKDDAGYKLIRDRIVTARKPHQCCDCGGTAQAGTRCRTMTARSPEGPCVTAYSCEECSRAMAAWVNGNCEPLESRIGAVLDAWPKEG